MSPRYEGHVSNRIETIVDRKGVEMRRNVNFRAQRHSDRITVSRVRVFWGFELPTRTRTRDDP